MKPGNYGDCAIAYEPVKVAQQVHFSLPPELYAALTIKAEKEDRSPDDAMRLAIKEYLEK